MNVSQIIAVTLLEQKLIMTQMIYGSCIYQTTYYWWPQARMGVFLKIVYVKYFQILKEKNYTSTRDRVLRWTSMLMYVSAAIES